MLGVLKTATGDEREAARVLASGVRAVNAYNPG